MVKASWKRSACRVAPRMAASAIALRKPSALEARIPTDTIIAALPSRVTIVPPAVRRGGRRES